MKHKIVLQVKGGNIQHIATSIDLDIHIIDYDNLKHLSLDSEITNETQPIAADIISKDNPDDIYREHVKQVIDEFLENRKMNNFIKWIEKYKPLRNGLASEPPYSGYMFETYGKELDYINDYAVRNPNYIWTLIEAENKMYIISGYHTINRFGYFITDRSWDRNDIEILI